MRTPRSRSPRRARKQLDAELERLTVPVSRTDPKPARDARRKDALPDGKTDRDIEAEAEEIRQMIEASYT